ncbi:hypothetical protein [Lacticaseibacillus rhamnosus]|uniref:hypothetical protein n=1 Tax=Lacticaseibacillus rhamnosus TaxID=47715 RepID=UPI0023E223F2|nr:hypothetical protein [Lacticaseibacillus rhamnosus]MDF3335695.1 hypothetical protein [Lacticaseibacillus rhamnosus]
MNKLLKRLIWLVSFVIFGWLIGTKNTVYAATPSVSSEGLAYVEGTSTADLPLLLNNPENKDINFKLTSEQPSIKYSYQDKQTILGIALKGWWPKQQGISNFSVSFMTADGNWQLLGEYQPSWTVADKGPETVQIALPMPIVTTQLKVIILSANHTWSNKVTMREIRPIVQQSQLNTQDPQVTLNGMQGHDNEDKLVENPAKVDVDLLPQITTPSIDYSFSSDVYLDQIDFIGWYPKDQGITSFAIQYMENGVWKDGDKEGTIDWKTPAGTRAEEEAIVRLKHPVITSKVRLLVTKWGTNFGNKISMKLVKPLGVTITEPNNLREAFDLAVGIKRFGLEGNGTGEFETESLQKFLSLMDQLNLQFNAATPNTDYSGITKRVASAVKTLSDQQQQISQTVQLDNLVLLNGRPTWAIDNQIGTFTEFQQTAADHEGNLVIDLKREIEPTYLLINAPNPRLAPKTAMVEGLTQDGWVKLIDWKNLQWPTEWFTDTAVAGQQIILDKKASVTKIRFTTKEKVFALSELHAN